MYQKNWFNLQASFDVTLYNMTFYDFMANKMETRQRCEFAFQINIALQRFFSSSIINWKQQFDANI